MGEGLQVAVLWLTCFGSCGHKELWEKAMATLSFQAAGSEREGNGC